MNLFKEISFEVGIGQNPDIRNAEAQRAIDLLQERRNALFSAAVTDQIDLRNCSQTDQPAIHS